MLEIAGNLVRWRFCRTHQLVKYEVCEGLRPISVGTKPVRASVPGSCHLRLKVGIRMTEAFGWLLTWASAQRINAGEC